VGKPVYMLDVLLVDSQWRYCTVTANLHSLHLLCTNNSQVYTLSQLRQRPLLNYTSTLF